MHRSPEQWIDLLDRYESIWRFKHGRTHLAALHAELPWGQHSDVLVNTKKLMQSRQYAGEAADDLLEKLLKNGLRLETVDRVVGPAPRANTLVRLLAMRIGEQRRRWCGFAFAISGLGQSGMLSSYPLQPRERVLMIDDVCTTGSKLEEAATEVRSQGCEILPVIGLFIDRTGVIADQSAQYVPLIRLHSNVWAAEECELCAKGSPSLSPNDENWELLMKF